MQAILGLSQIESIEKRVQKKKDIYELYRRRLRKVVNLIPTNLEHTCPWFMDIYVSNREDLQKYLKKNAIGTRKIYPALNKQKSVNIVGNFPITDKFSSKGLWLPSSLNLKDSDINHVCDLIEKFYE